MTRLQHPRVFGGWIFFTLLESIPSHSKFCINDITLSIDQFHLIKFISDFENLALHSGQNRARFVVTSSMHFLQNMCGHVFRLTSISRSFLQEQYSLLRKFCSSICSISVSSSLVVNWIRLYIPAPSWLPSCEWNLALYVNAHCPEYSAFMFSHTQEVSL
jgi:hypothetical protein